jgi:hypothetical protein
MTAFYFRERRRNVNATVLSFYIFLALLYMDFLTIFVIPRCYKHKYYIEWVK